MVEDRVRNTHETPIFVEGQELIESDSLASGNVQMENVEMSLAY